MVIITLFNKVTKDHWKREMSDYVKYPSIKLFFKKKKENIFYTVMWILFLA